MSSPIRVGMIGLSAKAKTAWASSAHLPYLQSRQKHYMIVALCNSSVTAAKSAIEAYKLPSTTKAYDHPDDLADDTEVRSHQTAKQGNATNWDTESHQIDLVVCNTRVDVHYQSIKSSLAKGKAVYCEWPLASNLASAEELNALAKKNNVRTMIRLQRQLSRMVLKVKTLVSTEHRIGRLLSSQVHAFGGTSSRDSLNEGIRYFTDKKLESVLGEFSSFHSQLNIQRPYVPIMDSTGNVIETLSTDVADHIMFQGTMTSGIPMSVVFRIGNSFKDTPGFIWSIHGDKGEIRVIAPGPALRTSHEADIVVEDFATNEVVSILWAETAKEFPLPAAVEHVASMYEAFADTTLGGYPDFEHAILRHRQIAEVFASSEENRQGNYL